MNDAELLREFVKHHSDAAFAGLVKNHALSAEEVTVLYRSQQ